MQTNSKTPANDRPEPDVDPMTPTVLVVSDDPLLSELLVSSLSRYGYRATRERYGPRLNVTLGTGSTYDAVVLDGKERPHRALEAAERIRRTDWATPIAILSLSITVHLTFEASRLGVSLIDRVSQGLLFELVHLVLEDDLGRDPAAA